MGKFAEGVSALGRRARSLFAVHRAPAPAGCACTAEEALKTSQERLHALFEGVETGLFLIDPRTHQLMDANSVAADMVGLPREKIIGNLCHRFVCPAEETRCPVTDLGQTVDNSERVLLTAGGERREIIKTVRPVTIAGCTQLLESFLDVTDRKRAETALKERTAYLHSLIELNPIGVLVLDPEERIEISNAAFERLFGYSHQETQGVLLNDLIVPADLADEAAALSRRCMEQGSVQTVSRRRCKDGTLVDVQIFAVRLEVDSRRRGSLALYEDITARVAAERSLRESEDRFRTAFDAAPYGMCLTALDGRFLHANTALCRMLGYSLEELLAGAWPQITHPDDLERSRNASVELSSNGGLPVELEKRYIHKAGRVVWARLKISPACRSAGQEPHYITQIEDITAHKQADDAQGFLASLVECSQDAIIGTTVEGNVLSWNRGAAQLYGYAASEMIGKHVSVLVPPDRGGEFHHALEDVGGGHTRSFETLRVRKDGVCIDVALTLSPVRDGAGRISGIAALAHDITARKRREQETYLRTAALESTANGIVIADCRGRITWVNRAFTQLTGYTLGEVRGQTPRFLKSGAHDAAFYESLWSTVLKGEVWHGELVNRRKDGSLYDEEMTITPVRAADGSFDHFVAIKQDITGRKRAEEELRFKTALLETESETTIDGILVVDRSGRLLQVNRRFARIFNAPQELVEKHDDRLLLEFARSQVQDQESFMKRVEYLFAHELETGRDELLFKDGRCVDRYTAPLHDPAGRYYGRIWYFRDISETKRVEHALRASEQRYRELFENAGEIIFTTDLEGRFTSLNLAGQQTFGYTPEEAAQLDLWRVVVPKSWEALKRAFKEMLDDDAQPVSEIEVLVKERRRVKLDVKSRLIREDGLPVGIQAIARDITGRDIAEMELRQTQKLESVGRLAAGIAHEINTPIQFVGDNARFLEDAFGSIKTLMGKFGELRDAAASGAVSPALLDDVRKAETTSDCEYLLEEIPKALAQTMEGVDRVATIVRAMKEFAHPEGKEMAPADLNKALLSTMTVARNELKYVADVETGFGDLPLVVCKVGDLNQVFLNLLVNAAHAIADATKGNGKGRITVCTAVEGDKVHISIADTGTGIPQAIRGKIFDPFFTTKEVGRGTGQGLAIARSVVLRHKGSLTFESELGKGTTFHIRLPISPEESAPEVSNP